MPKTGSPRAALRERDLSRWRLVDAFQQRLVAAAHAQPQAFHRSWAEHQRWLGYADYLGLFLFGLLNPVVRTMRGLCAASAVRRVQREVCSRPVSAASFSEAQHLLAPAYLWQRGDGYVGDRYYGEDYGLFGELEQAGVAFVVRLRDEAVIHVREELVPSAAERTAGVIRTAWVELGCKARYRSVRLRAVWVQTPKEVIVLVTNLGVAELSAGEVALLYKQRWQIELFFRWCKCLLGCRHWLAESPQGSAIQLYLALIAALLLQLYCGQRPNRRQFELIQFYLLGVATLDELWAGLQRERERRATRKTS